MSEDYIERNEKFLLKLKDGKVEDDRILTGVGSFLMVLFEDNYRDAIPLFFEFLSYKTGRNYAEEKIWVKDCLDAGEEQFKEFEEMMSNPLTAILALMMMSD